MSFHSPRYIHQQTPYQGARSNGFTAKISPQTGNEFVLLQVAFCAKEDQFCRGQGRIACDKAPVYIIPVTNLPTRLAEFQQHAEGDKKLSKEDKRTRRYLVNRFTWIWRYFL